MNLTFTVPDGSSNHGNPRLLCTPPKWYDFLIFFAANYFAHAATIITKPGQGIAETAATVVVAILLPSSGIFRAIKAILLHSVTARKNPLIRAARSGALCRIGKFDAKLDLDWTEDRSPALLPMLSPNYIAPGTTIHGSTGSLPDGYTFVEISPFLELRMKEGEEAPTGRNKEDKEPEPSSAASPRGNESMDFDFGLPSSYNALQILISFIQATWATVTVYRARGNQIDQYGFAAFGLTIVPYAYMSILNTIANLLTAQYPARYVVRTPDMDEVERIMGRPFIGSLDNVIIGHEIKLPQSIVYKTAEVCTRGLQGYPSEEDKHFAAMFVQGILTIIFSLLPIAVIGALSSFETRQSTSLERGFTMAWLAVGIVYGTTVGPIFVRLLFTIPALFRKGLEVTLLVTPTLLLCAVLIVPTVGGMVVVGKMLSDFGVCKLLD